MGVGASTQSSMDVADVQKRLLELQGQHRRAIETAARSEEALSLHKREIEELREALGQSQVLLEEASASLKEEKETNEDLTTRNERLWNDVAGLKASYEALEQRESQSEAEAERLRNQMRENIPKIESIREDLAQSQAKYLGVKERWKSAKLRNVVLQVRVRELNADLARSQRDAIMADDAQRTKIKQLRARCQDTQAELQGLKDRLQKIDDIVDEASVPATNQVFSNDDEYDPSQITLEVDLPGAPSED